MVVECGSNFVHAEVRVELRQGLVPLDIGERDIKAAIFNRKGKYCAHSTGEEPWKGSILSVNTIKGQLTLQAQTTLMAGGGCDFPSENRVEVGGCGLLQSLRRCGWGSSNRVVGNAGGDLHNSRNLEYNMFVHGELGRYCVETTRKNVLSAQEILQVLVPLSDLQDNGAALPGSDDIVRGERDVDIGDGFETPRPPPAHKRARSSSPRRPRKRRRAGAVEPLSQAEFVGGRAPGGSRTNLKDYTEPARKLLKAALHRYEARIGTINPYPPVELQIQWAKEIWDEVCTEAGERMQLTERMASMMTKYGAHARSAVVTCVRPLVAPTYGFKVGDSDKIVRKNLDIYKRLLEESGFHYEDTELRTGYAKNPIIMEGIRVTWFKNKSGRGVLFVDSFSPISLVTLAIIFTAIEFCIDEYSTGRYQQAVFDEAQNKDRFDVHLKDLTDWAALKPSVTDVVRQRMHNKLRASTGAALVKPTGRMSDAGRARALQELEAMDVHDNEGEVEDDE
ncbi:hypothetical protein C8R46DRAFT_1028529 [Mycena filopes]|nr:hypothetical protein C8R46DRAFT_1028529 [Mycena filopes]